MINKSSLLRFGLLLVTTAVMFGATSCAGPSYREIRRPAPGGGYYVERVQVPRAQGKTPRVKKPSGGFSFFGFGRGRAQQAQRPVGDGSYWVGDTMTGEPSMKISLGEQKVFFYKGGKLAGVSPISSGREGYSTTAGRFSVIEKDIDHKSSLYGDYVGADGWVVKRDIDVRKDPVPPGARFDGANMRYFMRITGAIGMHEGYLPGYPASHGCIRLPSRMAAVFYRAAPLGTPVEIVR